MSEIQNQNSVVPLSYCVRMMQMELDDYSGQTYEKLLQYAIKGYEKLNLTVLTSVKVAYLTMDELNRVEMPSDMVDYIKIGMNVGGKIWNLGLNNNIAIPREISCGNDARELFTNGGDPSVAYGYYYVNHYHNGDFIDGLFGFGGGYRQAYYRLDWDRGYILFDGSVPRSEIVIEYKSNGISAQTMVPRKATEAIVAFIRWRRLLSRNRLPEMREMERIWKEEVSELQAIELQLKPSEFLDMYHQETMLAPKR